MAAALYKDTRNGNVDILVELINSNENVTIYIYMYLMDIP